MGSLPVFREFIEQACRHDKKIHDAACYDLKLAVDEAITNIITHGYEGLEPGLIILNLERESDRIIVSITDFGHPFEPGEVERPDIEAGLEDRPKGGFGLFFIHQTMDEINYEITEDGNRLTFIKQLPA